MTQKITLKNSLKSMTSSVAFAVDRKVLTPFDQAGINTYEKINNFINLNVYSPLANFFSNKYAVVEPATNASVNKTPIVTINKNNVKPSSNTVTNTITNTKVIESN